MNIMSKKELLSKILNERSYYPECERKGVEQRREELLAWDKKYNEINEYYNVWGFDRADFIDMDKYLDHGIFRKQRYEINSRFTCYGDVFPTNYTVIMRDKSLFEAFISQLLNDEKKYVKSYAFFKGYQYLPNEGVFEQRKADTFEKLCERHEGEKLVFKRATGCSGLGVHICKIEGGRLFTASPIRGGMFPADYLETILHPNATWMIQPFVKQHVFMEGLNPDTVNIIRIVTFHTGKRVFSVPPMLVYSRGDTEVCNSDQGSYYVGIGENGIIERKAIDRMASCLVDCPVGGQKLPYFEEIKELVQTIHKGLPELFTVGWDVALTPDGPLVFEGNDGWCPYVSEWNDETALRPIWEEALLERKKYY